MSEIFRNKNDIPVKGKYTYLFRIFNPQLLTKFVTKKVFNNNSKV